MALDKLPLDLELPLEPPDFDDLIDMELLLRVSLSEPFAREDLFLFRTVYGIESLLKEVSAPLLEGRSFFFKIFFVLFEKSGSSTTPFSVSLALFLLIGFGGLREFWARLVIGLRLVPFPRVFCLLTQAFKFGSDFTREVGLAFIIDRVLIRETARLFRLIGRDRESSGSTVSWTRRLSAVFRTSGSDLIRDI